MAEVKPIKVKDLPAFIAAIEPVMRELADGDILSALAKHADGVIAATAIGAGVERSWLEEQTADVLIDLAAKVLEVNTNFFARVIPTLTGAIERATKVIFSGGTNGSRGSSQPDSATATS